MAKNHEESEARRWLEREGYTDIDDLSEKKEDPPDLVVNGCIGVEVRRLNLRPDNIRPANGVEDLEHALKKTISRTLNKVEGVPEEYGVYVSCDLYRAFLPEKRETEWQVTEAAEEYISLLNEALQSAGRPVPWPTELKCGISIRFDAASPSNAGKFVLMSVKHIPSGSGQVVNDAIENINRCIEDKTGKIQGKLFQYSEWWLVLVATPDVGLPSFYQDDWQLIQEGLANTPPWSRIVVITWLDGLDVVELI